MRVLITGGCGYIGSHTAIQLLSNPKNEVVSIDSQINASPKTLERIKEICGRSLKNYAVDIRDYKGLREVFAQEKPFDGIIHFAALKSVNESVEKPLLYYDININGLVNMLRLTAEFAIPNFIFSSSCSIYGNVASLPVDENTKLSKAESPYAHTKAVGEEILMAFAKKSNVNCIALRYFNPVGAHPSGKNGEYPINPPNNLVPVITQTAVGKIKEMTVFGSDYGTRDGSCIRDYIHVVDIADAHIKALEKLLSKQIKTQYDVFNLGNGKGVSVLEAIETFEKVSNVKLNYRVGDRREGDVEAIYSNCDKSEKILGWRPKYTLKDMMETAWKWQLFLKTTEHE
jgi:UDP-glucose 4-epimerase